MAALLPGYALQQFDHPVHNQKWRARKASVFEYTIKSCEFRTKRVCWGWQKSHENVLRLQLGAGQRNWSSNNFVFGNLVSDKIWSCVATGTLSSSLLLEPLSLIPTEGKGLLTQARGLAEEPPKCSQLDLRLGTEPYNIQLWAVTISLLEHDSSLCHRPLLKPRTPGSTPNDCWPFHSPLSHLTASNMYVFISNHGREFV